MLKLGFFNLLRAIQSTTALSVITFHIHTYCSPLTMYTCTNHKYTTLYVALSDYMITTFTVGRTYFSSAFKNKLLLEPKVKLSLLILPSNCG